MNQSEFDPAAEAIVSPTMELATALERLMNVQRATSGVMSGATDPTNENITFHAMGMMGETFELIQKLGWKYWKDNPKMTDELRADLAEEFADILAFQGLLIMHLADRAGLTPTQLSAAYWEKTEKNLRRFYGISGEEGYSGRAKLHTSWNELGAWEQKA